MSPVFIANPNRMCPPLASSSMSSISLNNSQIRTFINIYPPSSVPMPLLPSPNYPLGPLDLRKHSSSTLSAQALYHYYLPHLLTLPTQQAQTSSNNHHENKRPHNSSGMFDHSAFSENISSLIFLLEESSSLRKRKQSIPAKRFDFAKLADEAVKDKEDISSSSTSFEASSNKIDLSVSSTSSPAAITSGVSLLASTSP